jgi:predicted RNA-binding protein YlxR (DUF448 family)
LSDLPRHPPPVSSEEEHTAAADPYRRCMICRNKAPRMTLLRFVCLPPENVLLFDARHRAPGRGVHVCPRLRCVERAVGGGFAKGLKVEGEALKCPSVRALLSEQVMPALWNLYFEILSLGRKSGQLLQGVTRVERAAHDQRLVAYLLAQDASEGTHHKFETMARCRQIPLRAPLLTRSRLGEVFGRPDAVVLGWCVGPLYERACHIEQQLLTLDPTLSPPSAPPP